LRLLLRVEVEPEQLVVAAHTRGVNQELAVGRIARRAIAEWVLGQIGDDFRLQVDREDVADRVAQRVEGDRVAVRGEGGRFRLVHRLHRDALLDLAREHVLDDQRALLLGAHEVGEPVALGRPRHPWIRRLVDAHLHQVIEAQVLVEAARQVADDRSVLGRDQDDVELLILAVHGDHGNQVAGGRRRDRQRLGELRLLLVRRQIAAVVGRALLVAERLEAVLQDFSGFW
jgi:hypothetical protein